ncbi:uncharacterized protein LOC144453823 [Glandiceps talaboti]
MDESPPPYPGPSSTVGPLEQQPQSSPPSYETAVGFDALQPIVSQSPPPCAISATGPPPKQPSQDNDRQHPTVVGPQALPQIVAPAPASYAISATGPPQQSMSSLTQVVVEEPAINPCHMDCACCPDDDCGRCCSYCWTCTRDREWYSLKGKGCGWLLILLFCYFIIGSIVVSTIGVFLVGIYCLTGVCLCGYCVGDDDG